MDNFGNDVAQKMKSALKAKLIELDAYVDDELPEYIMVMVANKKSKAQMTDDLSLFLGDNTEHFTEWLHDVLNRLQAVAIGRSDLKSPNRDKRVEIKKSPKSVKVEMSSSPPDKEQSVVGTSNQRSSSRNNSGNSAAAKCNDGHQLGQEFKVEEVGEREALEDVEEIEEGEEISNGEEEETLADQDDREATADEEDPEATAGEEDREAVSGEIDPQYEFLAIKAEQESDDLLGEELKDQPPPPPPPELPPPPPPPPPPPESSSKRRAGGGITTFGPKLHSSSSSSSTSSSSASSKPLRPAPRAARVGSDPSYIPISLSSQRKRDVETTRIVQTVVKASASERSSVVAGHKRRAPSSAVGAVVRRQFPQEEETDEKYDPRHPLIGAVASTIQVSKRRSSLPVNKQANTALLLKAVNEAEKSILQSAQRAACLPVRERAYESSSSNLFTRGYLQRQQQEDSKYQASKYIAEKFLPRFTIKRPKEELSLRVSVVNRPPKPSPPTAAAAATNLVKPAAETVEMADSTEHLSEDEVEEVEEFAEEDEEEEEASEVTESVTSEVISTGTRDDRLNSAVESVVECEGEIEEASQEVEFDDEEQLDTEESMATSKVVEQRRHQQLQPMATENRIVPPVSPKFFITLDGVGSTLFGSRLKNAPLWTDDDDMDVTPPPILPPSPAPVTYHHSTASKGIRWGAREHSAPYDEGVEMDDQSMPDNLDGIQFVVINRDADQSIDDMVDQNDTFESQQTTESMEHEPSREPASRKKLEERCRFWPACKNGTMCEYHHPSVTCKAFPNCKFGTHCRYIHPNCKFDAVCSKRDCPYTHASPRNLAREPSESTAGGPFTSTPVHRQHKMRPVPATLPVVSLTKIRCRNFPNCNNVDCTFYHPKPCRYAMRCTRPDCTFSHPDTPTRDKMKWSKGQVKEEPKPTHISGRTFAVEQVRQKIVVTTAKVGNN